MLRAIPLTIFLAMLISSCGTDIEPVEIIGETEKGDDNFRTVDESVDKASYTMILTGDGISGTMVLEDDDAKTVWKPDIGLVFLNTDEDAGETEPIGTLDIRMPDGYQDMIASMGKVVPEEMRLSKTDQRIGTPMQLNGRLYEPASTCEVIDVQVGFNYIHGIINCSMERVKTFENEEDETISFMAEFVAKRK